MNIGVMNIALGKGAKANGICCVAVGNDVVVRGAFQVAVGKELNMSVSKEEDLDLILSGVNEFSLTYKALEEQGFAPKGFHLKAEQAINEAVRVINNSKMERNRKNLEKAGITTTPDIDPTQSPF